MALLNTSRRSGLRSLKITRAIRVTIHRRTIETQTMMTMKTLLSLQIGQMSQLRSALPEGIFRTDQAVMRTPLVTSKTKMRMIMRIR